MNIKRSPSLNLSKSVNNFADGKPRCPVKIVCVFSPPIGSEENLNDLSRGSILPQMSLDRLAVLY